MPRENLTLGLLEALQAMAIAPYSGDTKWLRGRKGTMRRRVGDWRVIFEVDGETVFVLGHRAAELDDVLLIPANDTSNA